MKKHKGLTVAVMLLMVIIIGILGLMSWMYFDGKKDTENNNNSATTGESSEESKELESENDATATIYPTISENSIIKGVSTDSLTVELPSGWSVEEVFEDYNMVKSIDDEQYLISSWIHQGDKSSMMYQRIGEGIELVASVKTRSGTDISVLKTPRVLFLAGCIPTAENCYLRLNGEKFYMHLYKSIPMNPIALDTDFPQEIINDFTSIAESLSI